jgi:hypothetical protein
MPSLSSNFTSTQDPSQVANESSLLSHHQAAVQAAYNAYAKPSPKIREPSKEPCLAYKHGLCRFKDGNCNRYHDPNIVPTHDVSSGKCHRCGQKGHFERDCWYEAPHPHALKPGTENDDPCTRLAFSLGSCVEAFTSNPVNIPAAILLERSISTWKSKISTTAKAPPQMLAVLPNAKAQSVWPTVSAPVETRGHIVQSSRTARYLLTALAAFLLVLAIALSVVAFMIILPPDGKVTTTSAAYTSPFANPSSFASSANSLSAFWYVNPLDNIRTIASNSTPSSVGSRDRLDCLGSLCSHQPNTGIFSTFSSFVSLRTSGSRGAFGRFYPIGSFCIFGSTAYSGLLSFVESFRTLDASENARQTDRQAGIMTYKKTDKHADRQAGRPPDTARQRSASSLSSFSSSSSSPSLIAFFGPLGYVGYLASIASLTFCHLFSVFQFRFLLLCHHDPGSRHHDP